jgi:hypothetical protein
MAVEERAGLDDADGSTLPAGSLPPVRDPGRVLAGILAASVLPEGIPHSTQLDGPPCSASRMSRTVTLLI